MKSQILLITLFVLGIFVSGCSNNETTDTNQETQEETKLESFEGQLNFIANPKWMTPGGTLSYIWFFIVSETEVYYLVDDNNDFIIMTPGSKLLGKADLLDRVIIYGTESTKNVQTSQSGGDPIYSDLITIILKDVEVLEDSE